MTSMPASGGTTSSAATAPASEARDASPMQPENMSEKDSEDASVAKEETNQNNEATREDEPPNGGFGWVVVACCAFINAHSWGINSSYGIFLAYYLSHNYFPGATYLEFAFVGGLSISCALLVAPVATTTTRIFSTRVTLVTGVVLEALALITASFASKIWHLFLSQGVCFGFGMGFLFVGSVGVVPQWFTTRRSLANATAAGGSGLGGLIYSLATNAIIQHISLPWAFRILGIVAFSVNLTCALIIKDRNRQIGSKQVAFDIKLFRLPQFWAIEMWGFFSMLGYIVLLFSLPNYAQSIGLSPSQASIVGAILNLGQGLGRPPIGYFSDRIGRINMAMLMTFLSGLFALVIWIPSNGYGVLIFYALVGGAVAGTFWATIAPVTAEIIGLRDLPSALSLTWLFLVLPCTFSEPIALEIRERSPAHYLGAQLFAGFMYVAAALCLAFVRVWKIRDNERAAWDKQGQHTSAPREQTSMLRAFVALKRV